MVTVAALPLTGRVSVTGDTSAQNLTEKAAAAAIAVAQAEAKSVNNITLHFLFLVLFL